tara:strand:+ start:94 stop:273 length:180 start_codon:yes stop_codon:yes gene_type:complete
MKGKIKIDGLIESRDVGGFRNSMLRAMLLGMQVQRLGKCMILITNYRKKESKITKIKNI